MLFLSDTIVGEAFVYEVQRGDSRTSIGARFGENPVVLARENGLRFPSVLNVGITLNINNGHIAPKSDLIDGICRMHSCTVRPWCMNAPYIRYRQGPRGPSSSLQYAFRHDGCFTALQYMQLSVFVQFNAPTTVVVLRRLVSRFQFSAGIALAHRAGRHAAATCMSQSNLFS